MFQVHYCYDRHSVIDGCFHKFKMWWLPIECVVIESRSVPYHLYMNKLYNWLHLILYYGRVGTRTLIIMDSWVLILASDSQQMSDIYWSLETALNLSFWKVERRVWLPSDFCARAVYWPRGWIFARHLKARREWRLQVCSALNLNHTPTGRDFVDGREYPCQKYPKLDPLVLS